MTLLNKLHMLAGLLLFSVTPVFAVNNFVIGSFSTGNLEHWESHAFKGQTEYRIASDPTNGKVLKAISAGKASGLYNKQTINLDKTPFINWSWRVENSLIGLNEQSKSGDDYAARIYVLVDGGLRFWQTKSINYVWAGNSQKLSHWPNAYTGDSVIMFALRSKEDKLNTWYTEKRNVKEDFKNLLGKDIHSIDAVAIMTDTDNSGLTAASEYGDIYFSEK
jgi:hypothetical protein